MQLPSNPVVDAVRNRIASTTRTLLGGDEAPPLAVNGDEGWFGPDSSVWVVHSDLAMLIGGVRALMQQTLHPLAMTGVARHSDYRRDPWGRLHRTGLFLAATTFGTTAEAEAAVRRVRGVHNRVNGVADDGRAYSANDPELLRWVHICEVQSFLETHQRYGQHRLTADGEDRYVSEMARVGEALGCTDLPRTVSELSDAFDTYTDLAATPQAHDVVRFLLWPPLPFAARAPYGVLVAAAIESLPTWAQQKLRLPVVPVLTPVLVRPSAMALTLVLRWSLGTSPAKEIAVKRTSATANDATP